MTIETASYINDLNSAYPALGDPKSEGDDHLRLLKTVLKQSFPNLTGAWSWTGNTSINGNLALTGDMTLGGVTATGTLTLGNASGDVQERIRFLGSNVRPNWQISFNAIGTGLDFTPSTTNGGSIFTTPVLSMLSTGATTLIGTLNIDKGSVGQHATFGHTKQVYIADDANYGYVTNATGGAAGDGLRLGNNTVELIINGSAALLADVSNITMAGGLIVGTTITSALGTQSVGTADSGGAGYRVVRVPN